LSKSIIKSCINELVEHFDPVLSLNCEFPVSETEEENVPNGISRLLGILAVEAASRISKRLSRRWHSFTKTDTWCYHLFCMDIAL